MFFLFLNDIFLFCRVVELYVTIFRSLTHRINYCLASCCVTTLCQKRMIFVSLLLALVLTLARQSKNRGSVTILFAYYTLILFLKRSAFKCPAVAEVLTKYDSMLSDILWLSWPFTS